MLADQTATTSGVSPPKVSKVSKANEIPKKGQKAAPKLVDNQSVTKAIASNSDIDVEDYYVIEDANESDSSKYVPCINYANDKVYPEDVKNGWVRLEQDTGPPNIYRFEGSCHNYLNLNNYTPGAVFDEFFEGKMWTILSENTNKYVHAKLREAKDKGDKDPIELLSEGADQNPCAQLNKWEDRSPDEMKVFVAHLIVMGILKKNSLEQYWSRDSILNMPFFGHYMSRNHFQNILWNLHISDPDETNPQKGEANHDPLFLVRPMVDMMQRNFHTKYRPGKELSWMKARVLLRAGSISSVTTPKSQTGSILNFLWQVNLALATFVALKFIQEMHLASHRVVHRKYRMHQKLLALS